MSKKEKLVDRLLSIPADLTWEELNAALSSLGYAELKTGKTGGSRRRFCDAQNNMILLHKPHPVNIVKNTPLNR